MPAIRFSVLLFDPVVRRRAGLGLLLIVLACWGWFDVRKRARLDPANLGAHKTDITVYTEAGAAMFDGRDPYAVSSPRGWHYLYPPLFAIMIAPLSALPPTEQALIFYALSCACVWGTVGELHRLWRWTALRSSESLPVEIPFWLRATATVGIALPVMNCLQRGQVGVLLLYLLALGARLAVTSTRTSLKILGGVVLALPVAIKLTPLLPAAVLAGGLLVQGVIRKARGRGTDFRGAWVCCGGVLGLVLWFELVPAATIGVADNHRHLKTWLDRVVANDDVGGQNDFDFRAKRNQSFLNGVQRAGNFAAYVFAGGPNDESAELAGSSIVSRPMDDPLVGKTVKGCIAALLLTLGVAVCRAAARDVPFEQPLLFALGCAATLIVSPLSWGHHYVLALPAMIFFPGYLLLQGRSQAAKVAAGVPATLLVLHYVALDFTGRVGLLGIGFAAWGCYATVVCAMTPRRNVAAVAVEKSATRIIDRPRRARAA